MNDQNQSQSLNKRKQNTGIVKSPLDTTIYVPAYSRVINGQNNIGPNMNMGFSGYSKRIGNVQTSLGASILNSRENFGGHSREDMGWQYPLKISCQVETMI